MKISIIIFVLFFNTVTNVLIAQNDSWYITPNNPNPDMSWGIDVDSSGYVWWATNEILAPDSFFDIYISKIDSNGQNLWKKNIFSTTYSDVAFIVKISPPYLFIGGRTESGAAIESADLLLIACKMQGDTLAVLWNYQWDGNSAYEELDGIESDTSGIYIAGYTSPDTIDAHKDIVVKKLDFNGAIIWDTVWIGTTNGLEGANGDMVTDENPRDIVSHYNEYPGRALLISFDKQNGNYLWDRKWDNSPLNPLYYDDFYGLAMSSDSFLYAVGPCDRLGNSCQQALVKYDRSGSLIWKQLWGGSQYEYGRAILIDGDSIVYSAVNTNSYGSGKNDVALLKYDSSGNLLDSAIWGSSKFEHVHDIAMFGNNIYLVGQTDTIVQNTGIGSPEENSFLIKISKNNFLFPDTIPNIISSVSVTQNRKIANVKVYPNPSSDYITVELPNNNSENRKLTIYNSTGQLIKSIDINKNIVTINGKNITSGLYFYKIQNTTDKRLIGQGKFIIQ